MTDQSVKHIVHGRPRRGVSNARPALDTVASRGLLTWWDLMSDLDPGWLAWSNHLDDGPAATRRAA